MITNNLNHLTVVLTIIIRSLPLETDMRLVLRVDSEDKLLNSDANVTMFDKLVMMNEC